MENFVDAQKVKTYSVEKNIDYWYDYIDEWIASRTRDIRRYKMALHYLKGISDHQGPVEFKVVGFYKFSFSSVEAGKKDLLEWLEQAEKQLEELIELSLELDKAKEILQGVSKYFKEDPS